MNFDELSAPTSDDILRDLQDGNQRFLSGESDIAAHVSLVKLKAFAQQGQLPKAVVLCCSDSRAPVEMIFDQDIGDLFVIRVAGNIIAPSLVGSVEYAVGMFNTKLVLVMGHTQCGAVKAAFDSLTDARTMTAGNIHDIIGRIKPHILSVTERNDLSYDEKLDKATILNVQASVAQLEHSSRLIEEAVQRGDIVIRGALLDIATGHVRFLDHQ